MDAYAGQMMLGKNSKPILINLDILLKGMTQTYMSCVFSALRYVCIITLSSFQEYDDEMKFVYTG